MSLQAYQKVAEQAEAPKQVEYRLFGLVTRALMDAAACDPKEISQRMRALHWNRRLWSALADDCAREGNALPPETRAHIISLALWVSRHTSNVMRNNEPIQPLIDVNRMIMQGLDGSGRSA